MLHTCESREDTRALTPHAIFCLLKDHKFKVSVALARTREQAFNGRDRHMIRQLGTSTRHTHTHTHTRRHLRTHTHNPQSYDKTVRNKYTTHTHTHTHAGIYSHTPTTLSHAHARARTPTRTCHGLHPDTHAHVGSECGVSRHIACKGVMSHPFYEHPCKNPVVSKKCRKEHLVDMIVINHNQRFRQPGFGRRTGNSAWI